MVSDLYARWDEHIGGIIRAKDRKNINEAMQAFDAEQDAPKAIGTTVIDGKKKTIYDHDIDLDLPEIQDDRSWLEKNYPEMPKVNLTPKVIDFVDGISSLSPERPEIEIEFDQNNLPQMPLALANFIETHSFQKELGSNILIMGIDNEKYINHSKDPNVDDDGITLKDIKVGEEILMDYRGFDDNIEAWLT